MMIVYTLALYVIAEQTHISSDGLHTHYDMQTKRKPYTSLPTVIYVFD